jgi:hypothetical protein
MKQTGMIRIALGMFITMSAVGGMEQQPEANLLLQLAAALSGLALMAWAARDIKKAD